MILEVSGNWNRIEAVCKKNSPVVFNAITFRIPNFITTALLTDEVAVYLLNLKSLVSLQHCHKFEQLRDEVYCQLMKQTTNNKSVQQESCQRGWRLFSIVAAYFICSDTLKPFLFKYLETSAYDKRRAYHGELQDRSQQIRLILQVGKKLKNDDRWLLKLLNLAIFSSVFHLASGLN